jgi:hypothetical protein
MAITNGYATLDEVKQALRIPLSDTVDDTLLETAIESASRQIDGHTERFFYNAGTATKTFVPNDAFLTEIDDLISLDTLKTSSDGDGFDVTWQASDYQLEPTNQIASGIASPYMRIRAVGGKLFPIFDVLTPNAYEATVQVTGTWGFAAIPSAIKQATLILSIRQFKRYDAPLGVAGFGEIGSMSITRIDPDVMALTAPFRKVRMA